MKEVMTLRIDEKKLVALNQINQATKIPVAELVRQGVDRVIETYQIYIPDDKFRKELNLVMEDSKKYLKKLSDED